VTLLHMTFASLVLCTVVLYTPHGLLCAAALAWQPMLIVVGLLCAFLAIVPLAVCGLLLRLLQLCGVSSETTSAATLLVANFVLQNCGRVYVLELCLQLQRLGWRRGWLLVRSHVPLVSLSIAVGAGFAATSLFVGAGALLAEAWEARLAIPSGAAQAQAAAATLAGLLAPSISCPQLPRLVQAVFQQTFYTCGQMAWTVMLGQAYAAAYPQEAQEALMEQDVSGAQVSAATHTTARAVAPREVREGATETPSMRVAEESDEVCSTPPDKATRSRIVTGREELSRLLQEDEIYLPLVSTAVEGETKTAQESSKARRDDSLAREVAACCKSPELLTETDLTRFPPHASTLLQQHRVGAATPATTTLAVPPSCFTTADKQAQPCSTSDSHGDTATHGTAALWFPVSPSPFLSGLVAESVFAQRKPAAFFTGLTALTLHFLYVVVPLSTPSKASSSSSAGHGGCAAYVPLQCLITLASVVWGLWIVHCERHPAAYTQLS
jgi:hypothetical protein